MTDADLESKLAKLEALFRRAGTAGEAKAAGAALDRLSKRKREQPKEQGMTFTDPWSVRLFVALCRKHGIEPYRYPRQRRTTVMFRADPTVLNETVLPRFNELEGELFDYVNGLTDHLIKNGMGSDGDDTTMEAPRALPEGKSQ